MTWQEWAYLAFAAGLGIGIVIGAVMVKVSNRYD